MDRVATMIRLLILLLCAVLFLAGALWNLCVQPIPAVSDVNDCENTDVLFDNLEEAEMQKESDFSAQTIESRIAALRIERDTAWQQLYHAVDALEFAEKQQILQQYAELQYNEQKLELLLKAKGIQDCLVVLGEAQANVIVSADILQQEYEKLFDLVLRNTEYDETQIILVPLE